MTHSRHLGNDPLNVFLIINLIWTKMNVLANSNGVISDFKSNFHLWSVNSLQKVTFLGLHVVVMLKKYNFNCFHYFSHLSLCGKKLRKFQQ